MRIAGKPMPNTDISKFPMRLHKWKTFIISFHRDTFSYVGHCTCHNLDFDGKKMLYEILTGTYAEYIEKVLAKGETNGKLKHVLPKGKK